MTKPERIPLGFLLESPQGINKFIEIACAVRKGALIIHPTETIYGIGGACHVSGVKERILSVKMRSSRRPLIRIASDRVFFRKEPLMFPPAAERLAREFWPGMLTLVLPSCRTKQGIAVRVSGHPFIREFFRHIDIPIYSTSANESDEIYRNDPDTIYSDFSGKVDFFIDAGRLPASRPSTIVKIGVDDSVTVVREGAVPAARIFAVLHRIQ